MGIIIIGNDDQENDIMGFAIFFFF